MKKFFVRLLASFFYIGYLPLAPGTWGSLAGLGLAWYLPESLSPALTLILLGLGLGICAEARRVFSDDDPGCFVLDEVSAMMLSLLWLPKTLPIFIAAFILFRILDTLKPGPIRKLQNWEHPTSIMWDDILAGTLVNLILQIATRLL